MRIKRKQRSDKRTRPGSAAGTIVSGRGDSRSFKKLVRDLLKNPQDSPHAIETKIGLIEIALKKAKRGNFHFWSKLVDLHESKAVNEDDLQSFIEKVYVTVRRHVEKLDGGKEALAEIARDLQREQIE